MDVYIDGKLYKSCIFNGFPKPNNEPMVLILMEVLMVTFQE